MANISLFDEWLFDEPDEASSKSSHAKKTPKSAPAKFETYVWDETMDVPQTRQLWQRCLQELSYEVSERELKSWLEPLKAVVEGETLLLLGINPVFLRHAVAFLPSIQRILNRLGSPISEVVLKKQILPSSSVKLAKDKQQAVVGECIAVSAPIEEKYVFENFVKGKSNTLAYNACLELAKQAGKSGKSHPLFFIYGSSGLGKTHLMHAVAHRYQKVGLNCCYFSKDQFFRVAIGALRSGDGQVDSLVKEILQADLLIIDDVHLINNQNGPKVSQFLMTLFEEFTQGDKQLILASDRPPSQMEKFDSRFLSRFSGGLSLPVEPPDIETRIQILQRKATLIDMALPKECAIFIAQNIPPDVRRLEGALNQVDANIKLHGESVSLPLVKMALKDRVEARTRAVNAQNIREVVAEYYGVPVKDLLGKKRARPIVRPRQMAMALVRELTQDSFPEIGQAFGGRDHTTVIHACEQMAKLRESDPEVEKDYQALLATLEFV